MLVGAAVENPGAAADKEVGDEEEADDQRDEEYVEHGSTVPVGDGPRTGAPYGICTAAAAALYGGLDE